MTLTLLENSLRLGRDFVSAVTGPYLCRGGVSVNGGPEMPVLSAVGCSDTSDAIIIAARTEGVRVSLWTQSL